MWIWLRNAEQNCSGRCIGWCETVRAGMQLQTWGNLRWVYFHPYAHVIAHSKRWRVSILQDPVWVGWESGMKCWLKYKLWRDPLNVHLNWYFVTFLQYALFITADGQGFIQIITFFVFFLCFVCVSALLVWAQWRMALVAMTTTLASTALMDLMVAVSSCVFSS